MKKNRSPETVNILLARRLDDHATTEGAEKIRSCISELVQNALTVKVRIEDDSYTFEIPCEYESMVVSSFREKGFNVVVDGTRLYPKITKPHESPFAF